MDVYVELDCGNIGQDSGNKVMSTATLVLKQKSKTKHFSIPYPTGLSFLKNNIQCTTNCLSRLNYRTGSLFTQA